MDDDEFDPDAGLAGRPLDADDVERMLGEYTDARMSGERVTAFVATAIEMHEDQPRVMRYLRCGATIVLRTRGHGRVQALLVYREDAQELANLRARLWGEPPSVAPARPHRERALLLAEVPTSALAAVPRG
jgi:cytochrome c-type biogenesis protein CcmH/NrfG